MLALRARIVLLIGIASTIVGFFVETITGIFQNLFVSLTGREIDIEARVCTICTPAPTLPCDVVIADGKRMSPFLAQ
jgi:hypothetical protein